MSGKIEAKLAELGITLPSPMAPIANYVPYVRTGNIVVVSGQVSAQSPFPSAGAPPLDGNGGLQRPMVSDSCMNDFRPLRVARPRGD